CTSLSKGLHIALLLHFARTTYAIAQLLEFDIVERDPDRRAAVEPARFDHAALGPVVDNPGQNSQTFRNLLHGYLLRSLALRSGDPILPAEPTDRADRVRSSCRAELAEPIELRDDLSIGQSSRQVANARDDRFRVADRLGPRSWQIHVDVGAGSALPAN